MMTPSNTLGRRVEALRLLQRELPMIGDRIANQIFDEIFRGDDVADAVEELMYLCEGMEQASEAMLVDTTMDDHYTDLVWGCITASLTRLVRSHMTVAP